MAGAPVLGMDNEVFHEDDEASLGGGDGEEQIDHAEDSVVVAQHEDATSIGLFEDEADAVFLFASVRLEVGFHVHQLHHQFCEGRQIIQGGGFNAGVAGERSGHGMNGAWICRKGKRQSEFDVEGAGHPEGQQVQAESAGEAEGEGWPVAPTAFEQGGQHEKHGQRGEYEPEGAVGVAGDELGILGFPIDPAEGEQGGEGERMDDAGGGIIAFGELGDGPDDAGGEEYFGEVE